ncbi:Clp protease N-terminal domain-containing protein [Streptomyces beijiangensis]|uniref:Clp R domain-containing protein n=1 Tax=Streptomyces beijiangensis TaxID=163361 RepID=A0A939JG38_9ACTN|nr:Clp protease N-terminal domain-containing protein [Streptomyces beijiangensis]MBO0510680.1 hypothetical protein [Streptomyces beijiangensis]
MPKINVYLPDELAEAVKETGVPVSAVCQRALEQAVRRVIAIRETVAAPTGAEPAGALTNFTQRAQQVLKLASEQARATGAPRMGTGHLLGAILEEGGNLAVRVLQAMEIEPQQITRDLAKQQAAAEAAAEVAGPADPARFDGPAAEALELAVTEATSFGHHYVGCEHLLLGIVTEPDGTGGQVLRALGAEPRAVRRAVSAALAGYLHLRTQATAPAAQSAEPVAEAVRRELQPLLRRIERIEEQLGADPDRG